MKDLSSHSAPPRQSHRPLVPAVYSRPPKTRTCRGCHLALSPTDVFCASCGLKRARLHPLAIVGMILGGLLLLGALLGSTLPSTPSDSPPLTGIRSCDTFLRGAGNWNEDPRMDELPILNSYGERCLYEMNEDHLFRP